MPSQFNKQIPVMGLFLVLLYFQLYLVSMAFSDSAGKTSIELFVLLTGLAFVMGFIPTRITQQLQLSRQTQPAWLLTLVRQLAKRKNIPVPRISVVQASGVNAFATSNLLCQGHIYIQADVLHSLTQDEIEAVLAHELCHISQGHSLALNMVQKLTLPLSLPLAFCLSLLFKLVNQRQSLAQSRKSFSSLTGLFCFPLLSVFALVMTRRWEFEADACAANIIGIHQYEQALRCLHGSFFQHPNLLGITTSSDRPSLSSLLAISHPDLAQRINALQEIGR